MDMTPPQAPPAQTQTAEQAAVATLTRIGAFRVWLDSLHNELPDAPASPAGSEKEAFIAKLSHWWSAPVAWDPGADHLPRDVVLAHRLAELMRDAAAISQFDGTLDSEAAMLARSFTLATAKPLPERMHTYQMSFRGLPYVGAIALTDDRTAGFALLFTTDRGWERYASLDEARHAMEDWAYEWLDNGNEPPGILRSDLVLLHPLQVDATEFDADPLATIVSDVVALQEQRIEMAWPQEEEEEEDTPEGRPAGERIHVAMRLNTLFDIESLLDMRQQRLLAHLNEQRLQKVPHAVANDWRSAAKAYDDLLSVQPFGGIPKLQSLNEVTLKALGTGLTSLGIIAKPEDLRVERYRVVHIPNLEGLDFSTTEKIDEISLLQLALENIDFLSSHMHVVRDGLKTVPITSNALRKLIRDTDAASRYREYLDAELSTSAVGMAERNHAVAIYAARLRLAAEQARLGYFLPGESGGFIDDHEFRGYEWVKAVLDSPTANARRKVGGHDIVVEQLTYKGIPVRDALVISVRDRRSVPRIVLYTPDAHDGRSIREFEDAGQMAREFLFNTDFEPWLLERLPEEFRGRDTFAVGYAERTARWAFAQSDDGYAKRAGADMDTSKVEGNIFEAIYDAGLHMVVNRAVQAARSTNDADADAVSPSITFEGFLRGMAGLLGAGPSAAWRFEQSVKMRDYRRAFLDGVDIYLGALDLYPFFKRINLKRSLSSWTRATRQGKAVEPDTWIRAALRPDELVRGPALPARPAFEPRYLARDLAVPSTPPDARGIHVIGGRNYIASEGKLYGVQPSQDGSTWRLLPEGGNATSYGPALQRAPDGGWRMRPLEEFGGMNEVVDELKKLRNKNDIDLVGMRDDQLERMARVLIDDGTDAAAVKIVLVRAKKEKALTPAQARRWNAAVKDAKAAPDPTAAGPGPSRRPPHRERTRPYDRPAQDIPAAALERPRLDHTPDPVPRQDWPTRVWHYTNDLSFSEILADHTRWLRQSPANNGWPSGLFVTSTAPRLEDLRKLARLIGGTNPVTRRTLRPDMTRNWIEINLDRLPPGHQLLKVGNAYAASFVLRPPPLPRTGHAANPGPPTLPAIELPRDAVRTGSRTDLLPAQPR
jgi:hypothetical protein